MPMLSSALTHPALTVGMRLLKAAWRTLWGTPRKQSSVPLRDFTEPSHKVVIVYEKGWYMALWCPMDAKERTECTILYLGNNKKDAFAVGAKVRAAYVVMAETGF